MTYFYGRLFAAEPEISAMFPAAMDGQRHRFYRALYRIAVTKDEGLDGYLAGLGIYISGPDAVIVAAVRGLRTLGADPALPHYDLPEGTAWQL